jgi:glycosyltransferase involved in cell wall biosynthesis
MKVLHVSCGGLGNGGVQAVIMSICRHLIDVQFDIVLFTNERRHYDDEFEGLGGKIFRIPYKEQLGRYRKIIDYFVRLYKTPKEVYKILKKNGPYDAIHCHNYFESGLCTIAARLAGVRIRISHSHNTASPRKISLPERVYQSFLKKIIKINSNVKIGCSKQALEYLFDNNSNAFVVNNAINLEKFNKKNYSFQPNDKINFIHVGRYSYQKNQLFLLDVFSNIKKKIDNVQLTLVGFGEDEKIISEKISKLGLENSVLMLPSDSNVPELLSQSDYFVFPSNFEGLGIVLLEAQVMGVKCFISNKVPEEANMGLCEYIELENGAEYWASQIIQYMNKNKRGKESVPEEILSKYNIEEVCKIYNGIYKNYII